MPELNAIIGGTARHEERPLILPRNGTYPVGVGLCCTIAGSLKILRSMPMEVYSIV